MTTPTTVCGRRQQAIERRHRELRRAEEDHAQRAAVLPFAGARQLLDPADDQIALDAAQAIDEQRAVEMIHLVLEGARQQSGAFALLLGAVAIEPFDDAALGRTTVALNPGTLRQPSSSSCMPSRSTNSGLIITIRPVRIAAERDVDDEDAQRHADLRRGQADPRRGVHRVDHVADQPIDVGRDARRPVAPASCSIWSPYLRIGRIIELKDDRFNAEPAETAETDQSGNPLTIRLTPFSDQPLHVEVESADLLYILKARR